MERTIPVETFWNKRTTLVCVLLSPFLPDETEWRLLISRTNAYLGMSHFFCSYWLGRNGTTLCKGFSFSFESSSSIHVTRSINQSNCSSSTECKKTFSLKSKRSRNWLNGKSPRRIEKLNIAFLKNHPAKERIVSYNMQGNIITLRTA